MAGGAIVPRTVPRNDVADLFLFFLPVPESIHPATITHRGRGRVVLRLVGSSPRLLNGNYFKNEKK